METFDEARYCELSGESQRRFPAAAGKPLITLEFRDACLILAGRSGC